MQRNSINPRTYPEIGPVMPKSNVKKKKEKPRKSNLPLQNDGLPLAETLSLVNESNSSKRKRISLKSDETIVNETPIKKKRGRPRKDKSSNNFNCEDATNPPLRGEPIKQILMTRKTSTSPINNKDAELKSLENPFDTEDCELESDNQSEDTYKDTKRGKKYTYTGHRAMALNKILNTLQGKSGEIDSNGDSGTKKRSRTNENSDLTLNEDGTSTCMVCNENVPNNEWITHKSEKHYNLAWRVGDNAMDTTDPVIIRKAFNQLQRDKGYLQCNHCKSKMKQVKIFSEHLDACNGIINSMGHVICAVCKKEMGKSEWQYHKYREHNNLAWREGDQPLNLQDKDLVMRILTQLYKAKKPLHCEKCKQQKKSVLGYLSHKSVCQRSEIEVEDVKVACQICGRKMLPVSMDSHMKIHNKPEKTEELNEFRDFETENTVWDSGRPRRAATQALQMIQTLKGESEESKYYQFQCDFQDPFVHDELLKRTLRNTELDCIFPECNFQCSLVQSMVEHLKLCNKKPDQYFVCKLCLKCFQEENSMKDHVRAAHNRTEDKDQEYVDQIDECNEDEDERFELSEANKKRLRQKTKDLLINKKTVNTKPLFLIHPFREQGSTLVYAQAYPWMLSFCEKQYSQTRLFLNFGNVQPWLTVDCNILNNYLPNEQESCDIRVEKVAVKSEKREKKNYFKLGLFEVHSSYPGEWTIFCGGPITSIAWLPTPHNRIDQEQILALTVLNTPDQEYLVGETYRVPSIIQFYNCGLLNDSENVTEPFFLFGLALNLGPIWHLEWCPSGCLNDSRLGLLAVAASDSLVYIYCIDNYNSDSDRGLIYFGQPVAKLQLESSEEKSYFATRISWSKAKGHRYVAIGYSNGVIALFDLESTTSNLLHKKTSEIQVFLPVKTFQAHLSCITGLNLSHYDQGNRWLYSASLDRSFTYWDLFTLTKVTSNRKYGIAEAYWPTHWPTCITAEEETTFNDTTLAHTNIKTIRDVMSPDSNWFNLTSSPSGIKAISFSDWLNLALHAGNSGELTGIFAHRMFFNMSKKQFKNSYTRCIFSVTKVVKNNECNQMDNYQQVSKNVALVFEDFSSDDLSKIPNTKTNDLKTVKIDKYDINDYPMRAVNRVALNPNGQSCSFFCAGYQMGFLRIRNLEFLKRNFNPIVMTDNSFTETIS
ncbi:hypothetical protein ABEB36_013137 [Hypothenemus hampei]|uniref:C2H2-type domain-containing protein n=1 Tax=Hypothenemus hampei TaxID=57062 RepID=A0ABD1E6Z6_HYPHA